MQKYFISFLAGMLTLSVSFGQVEKKKPIGWFISPEIGTIFHDDHIGRTVGASMGLKLFDDRLKIGIFNVGRSGPINPATFNIAASNGQTYKGSPELKLRADQASFGLMIAPTFDLGKLKLDIPVNLGLMGAGFYLTGEDRETPDGRRVSEWENQLMDGQDADFGNWMEIGLRSFFPLKNEAMSLGVGLHYSRVSNWSTYYDPEGDFYNGNLRLSIILQFESL